MFVLFCLFRYQLKINTRIITMFVLFSNFSSRFNRIKKHNNTIELSSNIENKDHFTFLLFALSTLDSRFKIKEQQKSSVAPPHAQIGTIGSTKQRKEKGGGPRYIRLCFRVKLSIFVII